MVENLLIGYCRMLPFLRDNSAMLDLFTLSVSLQGEKWLWKNLQDPQFSALRYNVIERKLGLILEREKHSRNIDKFIVRCDQTNNTPMDLLRGHCCVDICVMHGARLYQMRWAYQGANTLHDRLRSWSAGEPVDIIKDNVRLRARVVIDVEALVPKVIDYSAITRSVVGG